MKQPQKMFDGFVDNVKYEICLFRTKYKFSEKNE